MVETANMSKVSFDEDISNNILLLIIRLDFAIIRSANKEVLAISWTGIISRGKYTQGPVYRRAGGWLDLQTAITGCGRSKSTPGLMYISKFKFWKQYLEFEKWNFCCPKSKFKFQIFLLNLEIWNLSLNNQISISHKLEALAFRKKINPPILQQGVGGGGHL